MPAAPPCKRLGTHCRELALTLRVADLEDDSPTLQDAAVTWLLGHDERITFGKPYVRDNELLVEATVHVACKYLKIDDGAAAAEKSDNNRRHRFRCAAHGFRGAMPLSIQPVMPDRSASYRGNGRFRVFYKGRNRTLDLPLKRAAQRTLPVVQNNNPCASAPCRTADNTRGAACCRDLTLDVLLPESDHRMEALLRARKSPYLCKVERQDPESLECEVISACGYLEDGGIGCELHDRLLPNKQLAKPSICREWPDLGPDEVGHPGCPLA